MKNVSRAIPFLGAMLVIAAASCSSDPTDATLGDPTFIQPSFILQNTPPNAAVSLTATVRDAQLNQLGMETAAASSKPTLVRVDSTRFVPELNETRHFLRALATTRRDTSIVTLSAGSLTKEVRVVVFPP